MSTAALNHVSPEEYLRLERVAEFKSEYIDGRVIPMTGDSSNHADIVLNLGVELRACFEERRCRVWINDFRVQLNGPAYVYPDVVAVRGEARMLDEHTDTLLNPALVIEVLSPSTELYDRVEKFAKYYAQESVSEIVFISQFEVMIERYVRTGDMWAYSAHLDVEAALPLTSVECEIPIRKIYKGVALAPSSEQAPASNEAAHESAVQGVHVESPEISPEEYLRREREAEYKNEYIDGRMVPMTPPRLNHLRIVGSLSRAIGNRVDRGQWEVLPSMMRVKVSRSGRYVYPDVLAVGTPELEDAEEDTLLNPRLIVEVFSPESEAYDRGDKFEHYRMMDSLREYVLVSQMEVRVERFVRGDDDEWVMESFEDPDATLPLVSVDVEFPIRDIYEDVDFRLTSPSSCPFED